MYKLETKTLKKGNRIKISGELTIYSAQPLYQELTSDFIQSKDLLLDLSKVSEIDTAGVQLLLMIKQLVKSCDKVFVLEKSSSTVNDFFELFNLNKAFNAEAIE